MKTIVIAASLLCLGLASCEGQDPPKQPPAAERPPAVEPPQDPENEPSQDPENQASQDPKKLLEEALAQFELERVALDLAHKTVTIPVVVNEPRDPIEYLLIHRKGKRHEAMFFTTSKPSVLNGALLMVGLQRGKNASVKEVEPMPTLEEVEAGAETVIVTPAEGKSFWMTVKWETPEGKAVEYCVEDLILDLTTQAPVTECSWVYLGGRMAKIYKNDPEVYVADYEGNLVSLCYLLPDNHLATMRHKDARDDQNWWVTDKVPEPGTEVQFVFHLNKTKLHIERESRLAKEQAADKKVGDGK